MQHYEQEIQTLIIQMKGLKISGQYGVMFLSMFKNCYQIG